MAKSKSKSSARGVLPREDGDSLVLNLSPTRKSEIVGFASSCFVEESDWTWYVCFFDPRWGVVANCVISSDAVVGQLWSAAERFLDDTSRWMEARGLAIPDLSEEAPTFPHPVPFQVNVFRLSRHGLEAQLDGHYLTAHSIVEYRRKEGQPEVLPTFSVQLPLSVLVAFLRRVKERVPELRERLQRARVDVAEVVENLPDEA